MGARMRWVTSVTLTCGCVQTYEQEGQDSVLPDPGAECWCPTHDEQHIEKSWRRGR